MRKITLYMITTFDGFIAGENDDLYEYTPSEDESDFSNDFFCAADTILFGRVIYELFVSYWDTLDLNDASVSQADKNFAKHFRTMTRAVVSRSLNQAELNQADAKAILIQENIAAEVVKLKEQPGKEIVLICGPELLARLLELNLVDEFCLIIRPIAQGRGKALFAEVARPLTMKLLSTKVFDSGDLLHRYQPV